MKCGIEARKIERIGNESDEGKEGIHETLEDLEEVNSYGHEFTAS